MPGRFGNEQFSANPRDVVLASPSQEAASPQDPWIPPDEEIASLSDTEARAVADGFSVDLETGLVKDLAGAPEAILAQFPDESAVAGELAELDDGARRALYAELGRELALPL